MESYKKMYLQLFNEVTNALQALEKQNYGNAKEILKNAQMQAEESYISSDCNEDDFFQ